MRKWRSRSTASAVLVSAVLALSACGSGAPKVSSSGFISKCTGNSQLKDLVKGNKAKLDSLCKCVQSKLVAAGFGNRTTDDTSAAVGKASSEAGAACAQQVLTG